MPKKPILKPGLKTFLCIGGTVLACSYSPNMSVFANPYSPFTKNVFQQNITVKGIVSDQENNSPMVGVTVTIQGTNITTTTKNDGSYELKNVPQNGTILFSVVGKSPENQKLTTERRLTSHYQAAVQIWMKS